MEGRHDQTARNSDKPPRLIALRRPDTCASCANPIAAKTKAWWDPAAKAVTCTTCRPSDSAPPPSTPSPPSSDSAPQPDPLDVGVAGSSARAKYNQLHDRRERQIEQRWGRLAGVVKFLSDDPQSIAAWAKGSAGERILAEHMSRALGDRAVLLHDRKVPGSRRNIDHLAIAATGVWVIDTKYYEGLVELRDVGGWFKTDRRLYINRHDRSKDVAGLGWQFDAVRTALGDTTTPVPLHAALCFVEADWKWFAKPFTLDGVRVSGPKSLSAAVAEAGPLSREAVAEVAAQLAAALPSKEA